MQKLKNIFYY